MLVAAKMVFGIEHGNPGLDVLLINKFHKEKDFYASILIFAGVFNIPSSTRLIA